MADNKAFDSLVAQAIDGIRDNDSASARVQVEATRRLLNDVIHPPSNPLAPVSAQPPWVHVVLGFLHACIAAIGELKVEALRAVAFHRGFALVNRPLASVAKQAQVASPSARDKRHSDGSHAPSPVDVLAPLPALTPFPSMVPLAPDSNSSSTPVATPAPLPIPVHMDKRKDPAPAPQTTPTEWLPTTTEASSSYTFPPLDPCGLWTPSEPHTGPLPPTRFSPSSRTGPELLCPPAVLPAALPSPLPVAPLHAAPDTLPLGATTHTEPAVPSTMVAPSVRSGVALSIHNPANAMLVEVEDAKPLSATPADHGESSGRRSLSVQVANRDPCPSSLAPGAPSLTVASTLAAIMKRLDDWSGAVRRLERGPAMHQDSAGAEHRRLRALAPQIPAVAPGRPSVPIPVNSGGPPSAATGQVASVALVASQGAPSGGLASIACSDRSDSTAQVSHLGTDLPPSDDPPAPTDVAAFPALPSHSTGLRGPPPPPVSFAQAVGSHTKPAGVHRNPPKATAPAKAGTSVIKTTRFVIARDGSFSNPDREAALRGEHGTRPLIELHCRSATRIVMGIRTAIERAVANPDLRLIEGAWSRRSVKDAPPVTTGNFSFTVAGEVSLGDALPYEKYFTDVLSKGHMVPGEKWVHVQLRGVPTRDADGAIYTEATLLAEVRLDPHLADAELCLYPQWLLVPKRLSALALASVTVVLLDRHGSLTPLLRRHGVRMFGAHCHVDVTGDSPIFRQCGRCHHIGHTARSCKKPATFVSCFKCSGRHLADAHDHECKGSHTVASRCSCVLKCILCGRTGHHARAKSCPVRGRFKAQELKGQTNLDAHLVVDVAAPSGPAPPPSTDGPAVTADGFTTVPPRSSARKAPCPTHPTHRPGPTPAPSASTAPSAAAPRPLHAPPPAAAPSPAPSRFADWGTADPALTVLSLPGPPLPSLPSPTPTLHAEMAAACARTVTLLAADDDDDLPDDFLALVSPAPNGSPVLCEPPLGLTQRTARYDIVSALTLPSEDELRSYYTRLAPSPAALPAFLADAETGWGGLAGNIDACVSIHARFAYAKGFPMLRSQVREYYDLSPADPDHAAKLARLDRSFGGSGNGRAVTPLCEFDCRIRHDLCLIQGPILDEERGPKLHELARALQAGIDPFSFSTLVEDCDLAQGGTGSGKALLGHGNDLAEWDPALHQRLTNRTRPPPESPATTLLLAMRARFIDRVGKDVAPPMWALARLVKHYKALTGVCFSCWSLSTAMAVIDEHLTPFGASPIPWWRNLSPLAHAHIQNLASASPRLGSAPLPTALA